MGAALGVGGLIIRAAIASNIFGCCFVRGIAIRPSRARLIGFLALAEFSDPALKFIGIEVAITVVCDRCERPALECQQRCICAFGRPRWIPRAGNSPY